MWNEAIYPFLNFNCAAIEVWECISNFSLHFTGCVIISDSEYLIKIVRKFKSLTPYTLQWIVLHRVPRSSAADTINLTPLQVEGLSQAIFDLDHQQRSYALKIVSAL